MTTQGDRPPTGEGLVEVTVTYGDTRVTKRATFSSGNPRFAAWEARRVATRAAWDACRAFGDPGERPSAPDDLI